MVKEFFTGDADSNSDSNVGVDAGISPAFAVEALASVAASDGRDASIPVKRIVKSWDLLDRRCCRCCSCVWDGTLMGFLLMPRLFMFRYQAHTHIHN